jgi:hypothetical protein
MVNRVGESVDRYWGITISPFHDSTISPFHHFTISPFHHLPLPCAGFGSTLQRGFNSVKFERQCSLTLFHCQGRESGGAE